MLSQTPQSSTPGHGSVRKAKPWLPALGLPTFPPWPVPLVSDPHSQAPCVTPKAATPWLSLEPKCGISAGRSAPPKMPTQALEVGARPLWQRTLVRKLNTVWNGQAPSIWLTH